DIGLDGLSGYTMLQRHAIQKFHDDERLTLFLPDFMNSADIGMVQGRSRLSLSLEAGQGLRIFGHIIGQKLEGDKAMQADVLGLVDDAHATTAEFLDDAVMRDDLVDH